MEVKESEITKRHNNYYWIELEEALKTLDNMTQEEKSDYVANMTGGKVTDPDLAYSVMCADFKIPVDNMSEFIIKDKKGNVLEKKLNYL